MLFKRIESEGLSHYSYIVGDGTSAAVIDARRDCEEYLQTASEAGLRITHIFETHRNEDYLTGAPELARATGAEILTADAMLGIKHGRPVKDGETFNIGRLKIQAILSPGHTPGHMSYLLFDPDGVPWILFSGDALFAGDVGRTDFLGADMLEEMTGQLYDTIFEKLLPLGDHILLCPAHGPGSVCGASISEREWTTLGIERLHNPRLQVKDRADFVKTGKMLDRAPYFLRMEEWNVEGPPNLSSVPRLNALTAAEFEEAMAAGAVVLDAREYIEYGVSHIPGAIFVSGHALPVYGGWFLPYDKPILLVAEPDEIEILRRRLLRIGYDNLGGFLGPGMLGWKFAGKAVERIRMPHASEVCEDLKGNKDILLLDVRKPEEVAKGGELPKSVNINLTELAQRYGELPRDKDIYPMCGSGNRAMMGASLLQRLGFTNVAVPLGGIKALKAVCPDI
jgi:hydroxyacylglutathione hydrolase